MKTEELLHPRSTLVLAISAVIASFLFLTNCDEKKATTATPKPSGTTTSGGEEGDEVGEGEGEGESESTDGNADFDLCADGLEKSTKLSTWSKLVAELCEDGKIKELRKSSNVYTGGDPIISNTSDIEAEETNMKLYSSAQYGSKVADYWSLVKLQFVAPEKYKENFEYDPDVQVKDVNATSTSSTYNYINDGGEGGVVNYIAKTSFITLGKGQAYVAATEHIEKKETMTALKGLIIVNKLSSSKVEVFTISDQSYEHQDGQGPATESRALTSLKNEQKRAFANSKTSSKATELLAE